MTQSNTQSVRNEAESATAVTRIPTFDEVYAMPYVQESISSLIALTVQKHPYLASYQDDIRQEILIHLNNDLPRFNGRSDIKTFARLSIESGLKSAKLKLFRQKNNAILYAVDIDSVPEDDESLMARDSVYSNIAAKELEEVLQSIKNPVLREAVDKIANGNSIRRVAKEMNIPYVTLHRSVSRIQKYLQKNFS